MAEQNPEKCATNVLHEHPPVQQNDDATSCATTAQQKRLKALARAVLSATDGATTAQQSGSKGELLRVAYPRYATAQQTLDRMREILRMAADVACIEADFTDADLAELDALGWTSVDHAVAYLRVLDDDHQRRRGWAPDDGTAIICCASCGPVPTSLDVARLLPLVDALPTAQGCQWCRNRADGSPIPKPQSSGLCCPNGGHMMRACPRPARCQQHVDP